MPGYRLTPDPQSDLIDIRRYGIENWGTAQSQYYLPELRQRIQLLAETPSLGKPRPEVAEGVRSFTYESHVIYYIVHQKQLVIFAVLHQRMMPLKHLLDREIT